MNISSEPKISCKVCGEKSFKLREGFYYCEECGTKQDQVRAIVIEQEDFTETKHAKKQKIHKVKAEKPELTSWECYNYILRGLVESLLSMGAKEELKLMTLQVWATYLRRCEVAFFNKKHAELPKLGVRYLKRDSLALYNHKQQRRKNKQRRRSDNSSKSGESTKRDWRKNKRQLDESEYSQRSGTSRDSFSQFSTNTSSTGGTTRAIQLKFSSLARKQFKRIMPIKHLQKHEKDVEGLLECHKNVKSRDLHRFDRTVSTLNMKQIYTILAIALNLAEDDIELCDLVRFINEERLLSKNISQYFPENIAPHCKVLLNEIGFFGQPNKYTYKAMREQVSNISKFLCINEFRKPDISKLVKRYVADLDLPDDVCVFIERLINLLPPEMETRSTFFYPAYEARAMAYIVFVLKLIFGLDGHKEQVISNSAKNINSELKDLKANDDKLEPLFIWSEWMEFIEMRKIIVSQYNHNFCSQFDQCQITEQLIAEISHEQQRQADEAIIDEDNQKDDLHAKMLNIKHVFENFLQNYKKTPAESVDNIFFPPSLMPSHSYFKRILLHVSSAERKSSTSSSQTVEIPEFMRIDHTQRSIRYYLKPQPLCNLFAINEMNLKVLKAPCNSNRCYVGVFRQPPDIKSNKSVFCADFNISEEEWLQKIREYPQQEDLEFKTQLEKYSAKYIKRIQAEAEKRRNPIQTMWQGLQQSGKSKNDISANDFLLPSAEFHQKLNDRKAKDNDDMMSLNSIDVFNECDMEPIENIDLTAPRRRFDGIDIFEDVSSDDEWSDYDSEADEKPHILATQSELTIKQELDAKENDPKTLKFVTSKLDYWILGGSMIALTEKQKAILENKFPRSFFWLLETCAQMIGIEWSLLYEQLLAIEIMFGFGIEPLENMQDCIKFKSFIETKDINQLVLSYRDIW